MKTECRRTILGAKRKFWEDFCSSLDLRTNAKRVWRVARSLSGLSTKTSFPCVRSEEGRVISEEKSKADFLGNTFQQISSSSELPPSLCTSVSRSIPSFPEMNGHLNKAFTLAELHAAISSRKILPLDRTGYATPSSKNYQKLL